VATFYVLANPRMIGGAFLIAVILVMAPIGTTATLQPTIFRALGTILGSVFVVAIVSQVDSLALVYLIGLAFILVALFARLSGLAWVYYVFMVPTTASLNATTLAQVGELGRQRVIDNVVGGVLVIVAAAVAVGYSQWASGRGAPDGDPEVERSAQAFARAGESTPP